MYNMNLANDIANATMNSAPMIGLFFGIIIFSMVLGLIYIISYWKIFNKAGKPGIASIIPIYNYIVMIQIAKLSLVYIFLLLMPFINIYAIFKINIEISKKFGKTTGFGIGITLLPIIFIPLLAFSDDVYESNIQEEISTNNVDNSNNSINEFEGIKNIEINQPLQTPINNTEINNQPESIEQINPIENEIKQPIIENNSNIESENMNEPVINMVPPIIENIIQESNDIPVEEVKIESTQTENAFNSTPIEYQTVNEETPSLNIRINEETPFEQNLEEIIPQPITEIPIINENSTISAAKKVCKNCGETLPSIVSLCPKCGTDNE